jgi:hypothetical protein
MALDRVRAAHAAGDAAVLHGMDTPLEAPEQDVLAQDPARHGLAFGQLAGEVRGISVIRASELIRGFLGLVQGRMRCIQNARPLDG